MKKLEAQLKNQEEVNRALEVSMANETTLCQQEQHLEQHLQQAKEEQQKEKEVQEETIQKIKDEKYELVREKERITQEHLQ